jgi:hypothetical protein
MARSKKVQSGFTYSKLRDRDQNPLSIPNVYRGPRDPTATYINIERGLKPNTKYLVMLDNAPGGQFEDLTDWSRPVGESVPYNTHRDPATGNRMKYLVSGPDGSLYYKVRNYGTEDIKYTDSSYNKLWDNVRFRSSRNDINRDEIRLIELSRVIEGDSDVKFKNVTEYSDDDQDLILPDSAFDSENYALPNRPITSIGGNGIIVCGGGMVPYQPEPEFDSKIKGQFYQTFYVDSKKVGNSPTVDITDITLYVRKKPGRTNNISRCPDPGIRVKLLRCDSNGAPLTSKAFKDGSARISWFNIKPSPLANQPSVATFNAPVRVKTNAFYAIAIYSEDPSYIFWYSEKGDRLIENGVKTNKVSIGSSKEHRGDFYEPKTKNSAVVDGLNSKEAAWQPNEDLDLKFDVGIAEYNISDVELKFNNYNYEFLSIDSTGGNWCPDELVYKDLPTLSGTVNMAAGSKKITVESGIPPFDSLSAGTKIILRDSADNAQMFTVSREFVTAPFSTSILNTEEYAETAFSAGTLQITVAGRLRKYDNQFNLIRLAGSTVNLADYTANNDFIFLPGDTLIGIESGETANVVSVDTIPISLVVPNINANVPKDFKISTDYKFSIEDPVGSGTYTQSEIDHTLTINRANYVKDYSSLVLSRSLEVLNSSNMFNGTNNPKSSQLSFTYKYRGKNKRSYVAPSLRPNEVMVTSSRWNINNDSTNEHTNTGSALTKHISKVLSFGKDKNAEDIRIFMNAYRPRGTNIEVYARIINQEDSDLLKDKYWTKLDYVDNGEVYANPKSRNEYHEYELGFPPVPPSDTTLDGEFTSTLDSAVISTTTANVELIESGDVIKFYSPLFDNYAVFSVDSVNAVSQEITLNEPVANVNIAGEGFKIDTLATPYTAFNNNENNEIVRYFGESGESFDTYKSVQIKIVLLAENRNLVPKVDDYRVIGVSA